MVFISNEIDQVKQKQLNVVDKTHKCPKCSGYLKKSLVVKNHFGDALTIRLVTILNPIQRSQV